MSVFYMVEMAFPYPDERAGFDDFYNNHIAMLLSIDGFLSAQRFECTHEAKSPFLALYQLSDAGALSRPSYTSRAGPASVSETYRSRIENWHRNVVDGPDLSLDIPMGGWLVVIDRLSDDAPALPEGYASFTPVGLDQSIAERGVLSGEAGEPAPPQARDGWSVRAFKALGPRRAP